MIIMDYQKIYSQIIDDRKQRKLEADVYYENHHIIPKCLGGTNQKSNLVKLTAREHYIAHLLMYKAAKDENTKIRMAYALNAFKYLSCDKRQINSRQYEVIKKEFSKMMSIKMSGENNPFYGKKHTSELIEKLRTINSVPLSERIGEEKALESSQKKSKAMKGRTPPNKGKKMNISEQGMKNIHARNKKQRKYYIITRPSGEKLIAMGTESFCKIENELYGTSLNPRSLKNLLSPNLETYRTYKGYFIERVADDFDITLSDLPLHPSAIPD